MFEAELKAQFVPKYKLMGEYKFYRALLLHGLTKLVQIEKGTHEGTYPNLEFLNYNDRFIILYRREGDPIYLEIGRIFRKAAHKIYRIMLKKKMIEVDRKFLTLV